MGNETYGVERFTVRLPTAEYNTLKAEADAKGIQLAAHARNIIQAHLRNQEMEERLEEKLEEFIESDKFDDLFFEKLGRFFEARKKA
jgi:hypothetical protein